MKPQKLATATPWSPSVSGPLYFLSLSVALEELVLAWYRSHLEK